MKVTPSYLCIGSPPLSQEEAQLRGIPFFYNNQRCRHNHYSTRVTANRRCALCATSKNIRDNWPSDKLFVPGLWYGIGVKFSRRFNKHTLHTIEVMKVDEISQPSQHEKSPNLHPIKLRRRYILWHGGYYCDLGTYEIKPPYKDPDIIKTLKRHSNLILGKRKNVKKQAP